MKPIQILNKLNEWSEIETNDYKNFNHVNDVWNYLEASTSEDDLKDRISKVDLRKFGSVYYDLHKDGKGATVIIDYQDDNEDYYEKVDVYFDNELNEEDEIDYKQKFIDYCKGKIKPLGKMKIKLKDVEAWGIYEPYDDEVKPKSFDIGIDVIYNNDVKGLSPADTMDAFGTECTYVYPDGRIIDGGEMDAGQLNHLAELDFKFIDKQVYEDILDNWESWEMPVRFE